MKNIKIAILGATSQIAKGLIFNFAQDNSVKLYLFARSPGKVRVFIRANALPPAKVVSPFRDFKKGRYDLVINCVGIGSPLKLKEQGKQIFSLTEDFDNLVLGYLKNNPWARYINFSSGAVYRLSADLKPQDYYGIAKLHQEAKHRALDKFHIVDLRVFSYFSRFAELDSGYFLTDLLKSIKEKRKFFVNPGNFIRDYINPDDLFNLIVCIIKAKPFNGALDAYSLSSVSKFKLLKYFSKNRSLRYVIKRKGQVVSPTGEKGLYYPKSKSASKLGYRPKFTSLQTVIKESKYLLSKVNG
ncbi:MAG: NAD-dependent epimerase/dehydratase family protein [Candidatus Omnitrophica bacterium]|nr:NAD-dependent epimerase/dehydratase family protein [Candidatus Omnitrophota bacterium]